MRPDNIYYLLKIVNIYFVYGLHNCQKMMILCKITLKYDYLKLVAINICAIFIK